MNEAVARSARITRRTFGLTALAGLGFAAGKTWREWGVFESAAGQSPDTLKDLPEAAALKALGTRVLAGTPMTRPEIEAKLAPRLSDGGYAAAVARDTANGALVPVDGWMIAETTTLAAGWLASAG